MECKRLENQVKFWYVQVQQEAMAPARLVEFMEKHIAECEVCLADEGVRLDVSRISEIVLPAVKIRKKVTTNASAPKEDEKPKTPEPDEPSSVDEASADDSTQEGESDGPDNPDSEELNAEIGEIPDLE